MNLKQNIYICIHNIYIYIYERNYDDDRSSLHKSVKDASIRKYDGDDDDDRSSFHGSVKETSIISEMMMMVMIEIPFTGL